MIYEKLIDIQSRLNVSKNKHNEFGNFMYRSCEDILQAVKPLLKEHNLVLLLTDSVVMLGDKHYIEATAELLDGVDKISVKALAREPEKPKAKMDESQTTGSTSSYARKYALNGLFALDDNADSDDTNKGNKDKTPTEKMITQAQIKELKGLGFTDERLKKMAEYYKVENINQITHKQAEEAIKKQKRQAQKSGDKK